MRTVPMILLGKGYIRFRPVKVTSAEYMRPYSLAKLPGFYAAQALIGTSVHPPPLLLHVVVRCNTYDEQGRSNNRLVD